MPPHGPYWSVEQIALYSAVDRRGLSAIDGDEAYLRRALELAEEAAAAGDVPIGAVLICGDLLLEAKNEKEAGATPPRTRRCCSCARPRNGWTRGGFPHATLYVTKEPCVMCAGAMIAARVERLVYGARDPKGGADGSAFDILRSPRTNHRLEVTRRRSRSRGGRTVAAILPRPPRSRAGKRYRVRALKHSGGEVVEWLKAPASKAGER